MASVSASQVKALRDKTSVGIMDAKKALEASNGDEKKAIDFLREKGIAKAKKKSGKVADNGLTKIVVSGDKAAIVEVNSETDFVSSSKDFKNLVDLIANKIATENPSTLDDALKLPTDNGTLNDDIIKTTQITGEKINLRRFKVLRKGSDDHFGAYVHNGSQIAALVVLSGADDTTAKQIAMHVAALNPEYLTKDEIPSDRLEHEKEVLKKEALNEGKPEKIVKMMVKGRLNKRLSEICLANQAFVMDNDQSVSKFVASKGGKLKSFVRYQVGEGIEKKTDNFADEVKNQMK
ncbi:elongation factor Ts [Philodulcilactobacillus myokoensis]|uniref:Elongation factor Ts n=1 Tax=Philodulcilactobacillus myokoensis TaxID=2929573 RepID=A0A9W6ESN1_9LACO|nr:translation elongation factor Ts [Philodulcilactobacillus myokoensis]GLB46955.1 elongation factor Ts [Philodulcilactobacillus myokoensis]